MPEQFPFLVSVEEIKLFLDEDIGAGDLTSAIISSAVEAEATVLSRESMVICGQAWFSAVFASLDERTIIEWMVHDGDEINADTLLCRMRGNARALLTGERTALNLLQTLSATATTARRFADAVKGTAAKVLDTRKTLPGLRKAQKYAVRCGGCFNHRMGLFDEILIKENHIIAAGSVKNAFMNARSLNPDVPIEIEVESLIELQQALDVGVKKILLDNFSLDELRAAVSMNAGRAKLESSGNISLDNVRATAETGVDYISVGALTKDIKAVDLSMRITLLD